MNKELVIKKINEEIKIEVEKIFKKQDKISKFGNIIKYCGVKDLGLGTIYLGEPKREFEEILKSLFSIPLDYKEEFRKFYTQYNKKNPYRIEISLEKEDGPDGAIIKSFENWVMTPYWKVNSTYIQKGVLYSIPSQKDALIVFRPEKIKKNEEVVNELMGGESYKPTRIRFANDYTKLPYGSLVISKYGSKEFQFRGKLEKILNIWSFLIPGIKEDYLI